MVGRGFLLIEHFFKSVYVLSLQWWVSTSNDGENEFMPKRNKYCVLTIWNCIGLLTTKAKEDNSYEIEIKHIKAHCA